MVAQTRHILQQYGLIDFANNCPVPARQGTPGDQHGAPILSFTLQRTGGQGQQLLLSVLAPLRTLPLFAGMEQPGAIVFTGAAVQNEEMPALAQSTLQDLVTHDVPGAGDIYANEQDSNGFTAGVLHRLILGDVALAKQQREAAIDITAQDGSQCRAGAVELRTDSTLAVLFTQ